MAAVLLPMSAEPFHRSGSGEMGMPRYISRSFPTEPETAMLKSTADIQEVIIAMEEDNTSPTRSVLPPPPFPSFDPRAPSFRLQAPTPPLEDRPATPRPLAVSCPSPTSTSESPSASPDHMSSSPRSHTSSPTLVRNGSSASTSTSSPVMRSMFPRYDPSMALTQHDDLADGKEIICFDSSISQSLYKLSASHNQLAVSRTHPTHHSTEMRVCTPALPTPDSSDALVVPIFPQLAELMAIDKSSTLAVEHGLDRHAGADLQSEAIERAYRQEASSLLWDNESQKYYLIHPKLLDDESPAVFTIEVHCSSGSPREINILAPTSSTTLISLSFETRRIVIGAQAITAFSSLYLLDTLLSATLVLMLHLHRSRTSQPLPRTSPAFAAPVFEPPPTIPLPLRPTTRTERRLTSWSKSFFSRSLSPSTEHKNRRKVRDKDVESATTITLRGSPDQSVTAKLPHPPTSTFKLIDGRDERLPRSTRAVLRVLYWGFECLVWGLGVL
ncbi:MAG: hypothetical protein Q9174_000090, partial [Haloplaca sp. 1 TL-2023]